MDNDDTTRHLSGRSVRVLAFGLAFLPLSKPDDDTGTRLRETPRFGKPLVWRLPNLPEKIVHFHPAVAQGTLQGLAIHLRMKWKHYPSSIRVLHLDVASLAMDFQKTKPLQCGQHLAARQHRQLHIVNSTTSRSVFAVNSDGDGSKYKSMSL